jgi:hypothetical protein
MVPRRNKVAWYRDIHYRICCAANEAEAVDKNYRVMQGTRQCRGDRWAVSLDEIRSFAFGAAERLGDRECAIQPSCPLVSSPRLHWDTLSTVTSNSRR